MPQPPAAPSIPDLSVHEPHRVPRNQAPPRRPRLVLWLLCGMAFGAHALPAQEPAPSAPPPAASASGYQSIRELLADVGVGESYFRLLQDGQEPTLEEQEGLLRLIYAMRSRMKDIELETWTQPWTAEKLLADPGGHRAQVCELDGRVTRIERLQPIPEWVERFEMPEYFRVRLERSEAPALAAITIYTAQIPAGWKKKLAAGEPLNEKAQLRGAFFKLGPEQSAIFVARRIAWRLHDTLGLLGHDESLFDEIRIRSRLTAEDSECFYSLLAAAGKAGTNELLRFTEGEPTNLIPLLQEPKGFQGDLLAVLGTARKVTLIRVENPEVIQRFGLDHYWQIEMMVDLPAPVRMSHDEVRDRFPVVFCVRKLPAGLPYGDDVHEALRIPGFFFKIWAYETGVTEGDETAPRRLAPLFIGREPLWIRPEAPDRTLIAVLAGGGFVLTALLLWIWLWLDSRRDAVFQKEQLSRAWAPAEAGSALRDLQFEEYRGPDFSQVRSTPKPEASAPQSLFPAADEPLPSERRLPTGETSRDADPDSETRGPGGDRQ